MPDSTGCYHDSPTAIETYVGAKFDVDNPSVDLVFPRDIAHALANIGRYGGHCKYFYNVAAHSIHCHDEARRRGLRPAVCLMCLLHDGGEAYANDLGRPIKLAGGMEGYNNLSERLQEYVYRRFAREIGLPDVHDVNVRSQVKQIDNAVLAAEVPRLMRSKGKGWHGLEKIEPARIGWFRWWWFRGPRRAERGFIRRLRRYGVLV